MKNTKELILYIIFAVILTAAGNYLIIQRTANAKDEKFQIRGDSLEYKKMIEGQFTDAESPFRYRILIPSIAKLLPFKALTSLKIITLVSLFLFYFIILWTGGKAGISFAGGAAGLMLIYSSKIHLYNFSNPFLTDTSGLLFISLIILFLLIKNYYGYSAFLLFGILARESALFLAPSWIIRKQWKKFFIVLFLSIIAYILPRLILKSGEGITPVKVDRLHGIPSFIRDILRTWDGVWLFGFAGLFLLKREYFTGLLVSGFLLFGGAFIACFFATDVPRMFSILAPVLAIAGGAYFIDLYKQNRTLYIMTLLFLIGKTFLKMPNIIFGTDSPVFSSSIPGLGLLAIEIFLASAGIFVLRKSIIKGIKG